MRKNISFLAVLLMMVFCSGCGGEESSSLVGVPNPIVDRQSVAQAEEAMGVSCKVPSRLPQGYEESDIATIDNSILQILYTSGGNTLTYRTGSIESNETELSGDYNQYESVVEEEIAGADVTLRGDETADGGAWYSGYWDEDTMRYAFYSDAPLSTAEVQALIESLA